MSPGPDSPERLVAALASTGDRDAFAELVTRRQSWIRNLMRRFCGDQALADDLSQQLFLHAWNNIRQLRHPERFGAWLKRLAVTTWLQHVRAKDALANTDEHLDQHTPVRESASVGLDIDTALSELSDGQRLCIVLSYHEGMTHGEIAEVTGISLGTVKSHIRRGTERLKKTLSDYATESEQ